MRQRIFDQFRRGAQIELIHNLRFVKLHRSRRNLEPKGNVFGSPAFGQQLQDFTLTKSERFFSCGCFDPVVSSTSSRSLAIKGVM